MLFVLKTLWDSSFIRNKTSSQSAVSELIAFLSKYSFDCRTLLISQKSHNFGWDQMLKVKSAEGICEHLRSTKKQNGPTVVSEVTVSGRSLQICPHLKPEGTWSIKHRLFNYPSVKSHKLLLIISSHTYLGAAKYMLRCFICFRKREGKRMG